MNSTPRYSQGNASVIHLVESALPVPSANAGDALFRHPGVGELADPGQYPAVLLADLVFIPVGGLTSITGPVHLWARGRTATSSTQLWRKVELIETTSIDLAQGAVSYRINLSPWWNRAAVAAPAWSPPGGQSVTIRLDTYGG